jgi:hypothetical protein
MARQPFGRHDAFRCQKLQCPERDDKYKGHILRTLKKKYYLATKGVHGVQRVKKYKKLQSLASLY